MNRSGTKTGFSVLGIGAAACAACCAGPLLGFLGAAGLFTAVGVATFGVVALAVLVPVALWWNRRRQAQTCTVADEPVPVTLARRP